METSKRQMLYHLLAMRPNTREFPCLRPCLRPTFYAHISIEHCLRQLCPRPTCFAHPLRQSTEKLLPRYRKSVFWRNSFYKWCVPCAPVVPALASGALCAAGKGGEGDKNYNASESKPALVFEGKVPVKSQGYIIS